MAAPLLNECPVNLECRVVKQIRLPSHTLFVGEVLTVHVEPALLDLHGEVDLRLTGEGPAYRAAVVRERPIENFQPAALLRRIRAWRDDRDRKSRVVGQGGRRGFDSKFCDLNKDPSINDLFHIFTNSLTGLVFPTL